MKALSLWQPWASFVAYGYKRYETRSWGTLYRGPLAIHASLTNKSLRPAFVDELIRSGDLNGAHIVSEVSFPRGCIVAIAQLWDCLMVPAWGMSRLSRQEQALGDFSPFRFAWALMEVVRLPEPVPCRGWQRLFNLPTEVEHAVGGQIERSKNAEKGQLSS